MDEEYMRQALAVARFAAGRTSPNPLVGAVVVNDGRIVGQGWHRKAGTPHAEVHALRQAGDLANGAALYVTLEPCSHYGKTPPCAEAVIQSGIKRVVVAMRDPNPLVAGRGLEALRRAGIQVEEGILRAEAEALNEVFLKWITTRCPFVALKMAMTLDGKIATAAGQSKWITNEASRRYAHQLRDFYDGILVGIGTVLADDPSLTARLPEGGKNPTRIVLDSLARTPVSSQLVTDQKAPTIIAVTERAPQERIERLKRRGVEVFVFPSDAKGNVSLRPLLQQLGQNEICSLLVEGGSSVNGAFVTQGLVDRVHAFIAPKLVGGMKALTSVGGEGIAALSEACRLEDLKVQTLEGDLLITAKVVKEEAVGCLPDL